MLFVRKPTGDDPDAREREFLELFARHRGELRAFVRSVIRDRDLCEDILQETALILWKSYPRYDRSRPFGPWARGVTAKAIMKSLDRVRRQAPVLAPDVIEALTAAHDRQMDQMDGRPVTIDALRACLQKLPARSQRIVQLRYGQALKLHEIATEVGGTMDAVRIALSRIRTALLACLERGQRDRA